jgi:lysine 2,3-aminomutase
MEIMRGLRGHTTGYAVPTFVVDAPGGGGKIPVHPDQTLERHGDYVLLRNFEGKTVHYFDPRPGPMPAVAATEMHRPQ